MVNIRFPATNVISCVFSLKNSERIANTALNEYDMVEDSRRAGLKEYYYQVPKYLQGQLAPGDFVVVHCQTGYQVCQVLKVNTFCATETSKLASVVARVELMDYLNDLENQKQLKQMKEALVKERKRLEEQVTWDLIASKNPEFAAMLKAFRDAGGEL